MGRWGDGEMGRWGEGRNYACGVLLNNCFVRELGMLYLIKGENCYN
ncbi:MAG: hypothetical protein F6K36_08980 [Symploca sp. SIO3C6]|uniref:Uncharacterized protein n=1 Tax=Symploca sp. SIO1C4 TaxID=2607765 RepID=A0A6B3NAW9_9CYAN|nr:hypothetical protein [Symploca sp. SIO3C6]NER30736.1 hypothetical protein [Symploca sp. SIO1C4]